MNSHHLDKENGFTLHPDVEDGLADPLCCSRWLTPFINKRRGKWDTFIADDKIVEDECGTWTKTIDHEDH